MNAPGGASAPSAAEGHRFRRASAVRTSFTGWVVVGLLAIIVSRVVAQVAPLARADLFHDADPHADPRGGRERGDVPGWVLITLMTAGLVTMLWAVAGEQLRELFTTALAAVTGPTR